MALGARQHGMPFADPSRSDQAARLRALIEGHRPIRQQPRPLPIPERRISRPPIVTVSSGKGGVGKTSIGVNLAIALADLGRRTTLVDADLGMANADVLCGLTPSQRLDRALDSGRGLREIAVQAPGGFRLVPGAIGVERLANLDEADRACLLRALRDLEEDSDVVVVDTAAGMGTGVTTLMGSADVCLVVATPEPTSITDAYALIKVARRMAGSGTPGSALQPLLVVNQAAGEPDARAVHARLAGVCERFLAYRLPLLGWVPHDARLARAVRARRPLLIDSPTSAASRQIRTLALALVRVLRAHPVAEGIPRSRGLGRLLSALVLRGR